MMWAARDKCLCTCTYEVQPRLFDVFVSSISRRVLRVMQLSLSHHTAGVDGLAEYRQRL
jgi:hypothetical protein